MARPQTDPLPSGAAALGPRVVALMADHTGEHVLHKVDNTVAEGLTVCYDIYTYGWSWARWRRSWAWRRPRPANPKASSSLPSTPPSRPPISIRPRPPGSRPLL